MFPLCLAQSYEKYRNYFRLALRESLKTIFHIDFIFPRIDVTVCPGDKGREGVYLGWWHAGKISQFCGDIIIEWPLTVKSCLRGQKSHQICQVIISRDCTHRILIFRRFFLPKWRPWKWTNMKNEKNKTATKMAIKFLLEFTNSHELLCILWSEKLKIAKWLSVDLNVATIFDKMDKSASKISRYLIGLYTTGPFLPPALLTPALINAIQ